MYRWDTFQELPFLKNIFLVISVVFTSFRWYCFISNRSLRYEQHV